MNDNPMEKKIIALLKKRGHPVELSVLWTEIQKGSEVVHVAYSMFERGLIWWLPVGEEHCIVGLPEQEKPSDPMAFLEGTPMSNDQAA